MHRVTELLDAAASGDRQAAADLLPLIYDELRRLASNRLDRETPGQTLQPTALVHEAYLRLAMDPDGGEPKWDNRGHFFAAAAEAMRRILVEAARKKSRVRHGGELNRVDLEHHDPPARLPPEEILAIDEALKRLAAEDPQSARIVELHFFAGMSMDDIAVSLGLSRASAYRQWSYARAWLRCEIGGSDEDSPGS